jgi:hypothetical protein
MSMTRVMSDFGNAAHPIFAFGGLACVTEHHLALARDWGGC